VSLLATIDKAVPGRSPGRWPLRRIWRRFAFEFLNALRRFALERGCGLGIEISPTRWTCGTRRSRAAISSQFANVDLHPNDIQPVVQRLGEQQFPSVWIRPVGADEAVAGEQHPRLLFLPPPAIHSRAAGTPRAIRLQNRRRMGLLLKEHALRQQSAGTSTHIFMTFDALGRGRI